AVADPDERGKLAYLLIRSRVRADERAEQFKGTPRLLLAELADEQLQPLPRCHAPSLTANAVTCRAPSHQAGWMSWKRRTRLYASTAAWGPWHLAVSASAVTLCAV